MIRNRNPFPVRLALCCGAVLGLLAVTGCEYDLKPLKGADGQTLVYAAVGKGGAPNSGIVLTRIGAVVIDPPLSPTIGERINAFAWAKSKIFWDNLYKNQKSAPSTLAPPVLYVLNTTYRGSHSFGNRAFDKSADFISSEKAGKKLADIDENAKMREVLKNEFHVPGVENQVTLRPTITVEGTMSINTEDVEIKFITMGDCVGEGDAVVYLPQQKILFAGDLVIPGFVPYPKGRTATIGNWIAALDRLEKLEIDVVVPGHGFEGGKDLIAKQKAFLQALVAQTQAAIKAGKTVEQAMKEVQLPNFGTWANSNEWLAGNVRLAYEELTKGSSNSRGQGANPNAGTGAAAASAKGIEGFDGFGDK